MVNFTVRMNFYLWRNVIVDTLQSDMRLLIFYKYWTAINKIRGHTQWQNYWGQVGKVGRHFSGHISGNVVSFIRFINKIIRYGNMVWNR